MSSFQSDYLWVTLYTITSSRLTVKRMLCRVSHAMVYCVLSINMSVPPKEIEITRTQPFKIGNNSEVKFGFDVLKYNAVA